MTWSVILYENQLSCLSFQAIVISEKLRNNRYDSLAICLRIYYSLVLLSKDSWTFKTAVKTAIKTALKHLSFLTLHLLFDTIFMPLLIRSTKNLRLSILVIFNPSLVGLEEFALLVKSPASILYRELQSKLLILLRNRRLPYCKSNTKCWSAGAIPSVRCT